MGFLVIVTIAAILWALRERGLRAQQAITHPTPTTTPSSPPAGASWQITWKDGRQVRTATVAAASEADALKQIMQSAKMRYDQIVAVDPI